MSAFEKIRAGLLDALGLVTRAELDRRLDVLGKLAGGRETDLYRKHGK